MRIRGDTYKLFSVLNSIFFLSSCVFSSGVNSCLWVTVFSLKQAMAWFGSAGDENTVECMTGVREKYHSQPHEAFRINPKFATPCASCSFQSCLRGGCPRDPQCVWGRVVERSRVGVLFFVRWDAGAARRRGGSSCAVEVLVQLVNLCAAVVKYCSLAQKG